MTIGVVVIGRNEGQRLVNCLKSIPASPMVYVDSGSTDNSLQNAREQGADTVELDLSIPFTAARARNAGFQYLVTHHPEIEFVFFVDGDCQVAETWLERAVTRMTENPQLGAVCGRRREIHPERSIYNDMCDMEWNTPVGQANACGGDAVYRCSVLQRVNGFDPAFIAGEEPELCFRIRESGYSIERMDEDMTYHDADMTRFGQWWKRTERSGHAYYLGWAKHGDASSERYYAKEVKSIVTWAVIFASLVVLSVLFVSLFPLLFLLALLILQTMRIFSRLDQRYADKRTKVRLIYSASMMIGKIPQALGVYRAYRIQKRGLQATLVEYK